MFLQICNNFFFLFKKKPNKHSIKKLRSGLRAELMFVRCRCTGIEFFLTTETCFCSFVFVDISRGCVGKVLEKKNIYILESCPS